MSEEKLRSLLAEAWEVMRDFAENWDCDTDAHKYGTTCRVCDAGAMKEHIDAALAEPVGGACCGWKEQFNRVVVERNVAQAQRDEARAEVERLKARQKVDRECANTHIQSLHNARLKDKDDHRRGAEAIREAAATAAYQRGAEAMREAVRRIAVREPGASQRVVELIENLPLPEDTP